MANTKRTDHLTDYGDYVPYHKPLPLQEMVAMGESVRRQGSEDDKSLGDAINTFGSIIPAPMDVNWFNESVKKYTQPLEELAAKGINSPEDRRKLYYLKAKFSNDPEMKLAFQNREKWDKQWSPIISDRNNQGAYYEGGSTIDAFGNIKENVNKESLPNLQYTPYEDTQPALLDYFGKYQAQVIANSGGELEYVRDPEGNIIPGLFAHKKTVNKDLSLQMMDKGIDSLVDRVLDGTFKGARWLMANAANNTGELYNDDGTINRQAIKDYITTYAFPYLVKDRSTDYSMVGDPNKSGNSIEAFISEPPLVNPTPLARTETSKQLQDLENNLVDIQNSFAPDGSAKDPSGIIKTIFTLFPRLVWNNAPAVGGLMFDIFKNVTEAGFEKMFGSKEGSRVYSEVQKGNKGVLQADAYIKLFEEIKKGNESIFKSTIDSDPQYWNKINTDFASGLREMAGIPNNDPKYGQAPTHTSSGYIYDKNAQKLVNRALIAFREGRSNSVQSASPKTGEQKAGLDLAGAYTKGNLFNTKGVFTVDSDNVEQIREKFGYAKNESPSAKDLGDPVGLAGPYLVYAVPNKGNGAVQGNVFTQMDDATMKSFPFTAGYYKAALLNKEQTVYVPSSENGKTKYVQVKFVPGFYQDGGELQWGVKTYIQGDNGFHSPKDDKIIQRITMENLAIWREISRMGLTITQRNKVQ